MRRRPAFWERRAWVGACALLVVLAPVAESVGDTRDDSGYTLLCEWLGAGAPDGSGVHAAQIEALYGDPEGYVPDADHAEFLGGNPKTFNLMSGPMPESVHATMVGRNYYGLVRSLAPDITTIDVYEADSWLADVVGLTSKDAPVAMAAQVANASWATFDINETNDTKALRRADFLVERDGLILVVAVNNGSETAMPGRMSSGYNSIAVGLTGLNHSPGPTLLDDPGRAKPDIVAPSNLTSYATPLVSGAAACLIEKANERSWADAQRPEVVKSLLMAGARKLRGWERPWDDDENPTYQLPLDLSQGSGTLRIDQSYLVFDAGQQTPSTDETDLKSHLGWDYHFLTEAEDVTYYIELPGPVAELTVNLTWLRRHEGDGDDRWWPGLPPVTLDNLDLEVTEADGTAVDGGVSASPIDNVEHVRLRDLTTPDGSGDYEYCITVSLTEDDYYSEAGEYYGIAWHARLLGDVNENGVVTADDLVAYRDVYGFGMTGPGYDTDTANWTRNRDANDNNLLEVEDGYGLAQYLGAGGPGDSDLDGDVDAVDLARLGLSWSPDGTDGTWLEGDADFDGDVDAVDLALFGLSWSPEGSSGDYATWAGSGGNGSVSLSWVPGSSGDAVGGTRALPEPATLALLAAGAALVWRRAGRGG